MNLYLISQDKVCGYETYDSAVVAAGSEDDARLIHPEGDIFLNGGAWVDSSGVEDKHNWEWVSPTDIDCVKVELLGKTIRERGVILSSFTAG